MVNKDLEHKIIRSRFKFNSKPFNIFFRKAKNNQIVRTKMQPIKVIFDI